MKTYSYWFKRFLPLLILTCIFLAGCTTAETMTTEVSMPTSVISPAEIACTVTEAEWLKPPEDPAVNDAPADGYYFVNSDRSIWASAWWTQPGEDYPHASGDDIKVGWFRPEGAELEITGLRLDGQAPPLQSEVPCCYPTRFQATGLIFPTEGCWKITAKAADSLITFTVWIDP